MRLCPLPDGNKQSGPLSSSGRPLNQPLPMLTASLRAEVFLGGLHGRRRAAPAEKTELVIPADSNYNDGAL